MSSQIVAGEGFSTAERRVSCIPGIPPDPLPLPDQQSERVFVLSGLAWLETLHMMEPTAAGAASSACPLLRQSVCMRLDLGSSGSDLLPSKTGSAVHNENL